MATSGCHPNPGEASQARLSPPCASPHPAYLMQLFALRGKLGHNGFHAAPACTQCGLWGLTLNSWGHTSKNRGLPSPSSLFTPLAC